MMKVVYAVYEKKSEPNFGIIFNTNLSWKL